MLDRSRKDSFFVRVPKAQSWGIIDNMNLLSYLRDTLTELKLVRWPSKKDTLNLTVLVIVISLIVGVYVGGLDYLFTNILKIITTQK